MKTLILPDELNIKIESNEVEIVKTYIVHIDESEMKYIIIMKLA